jgi:hypothetical protein
VRKKEDRDEREGTNTGEDYGAQNRGNQRRKQRENRKKEKRIVQSQCYSQSFVSSNACKSGKFFVPSSSIFYYIVTVQLEFN